MAGVRGAWRQETTAPSKPSPAGLDLYARLHPAMLAVRGRVMATLSEREREALRDLLARVIVTNELKALNFG